MQKVKADYLIADIDRAFADWQQGDYAQRINFDEFCEYLLPYKVTENQTLDDWRIYLSETWGDEYELSFWDKEHWSSLGKKKADNIYITFDNCPTDALFLLHDLTRGIEDRIFTYENGKQVFW